MKFQDTSFKFYLHKCKKTNTYGYIYLQKIHNRTKNYKSLGLPKIHEKYWNESTQRVRERKEVDYELYNTSIERELKKLTSRNGNWSINREGHKSFIRFFEEYLNSEEMRLSHGTRIKYHSVLSKLKLHIQSIGLNDLTFDRLNLDYIKKFKSFCEMEGLTTNTTIHYLKIIRVIIRKSQKTEGFYFVEDPFINYQFPKVQKKMKEFLSEKELQKIIKKKITDPRRQKVRNLFLFQLFSKGMRVSDLITLQFRNLVNGRIKYKMFKTSNEMDIKITLLHLELLNPFIQFSISLNELTVSEFSDWLQEELKKLKESKYKKVVYDPSKGNSTKPIRKSPIGKITRHPYSDKPMLLDLYNKMIPRGRHYVSMYELILNQMTIVDLQKELQDLLEFQKKKGKLSSDYSELYKTGEFDLDKEIEFIKGKIRDIQKKYLDLCIEELTDIGYGEKKDEFVFGLLEKSEFVNGDSEVNFSNLTESQYKRINKVSIVYNRNLKELQKITGIKKSLKSHLPRTTYTNLMFNMEGVSHYDIMEGLGHSSLMITKHYMNTGFRKKDTDVIQERFEDSLNKRS